MQEPLARFPFVFTLFDRDHFVKHLVASTDHYDTEGILEEFAPKTRRPATAPVKANRAEF